MSLVDLYSKLDSRFEKKNKSHMDQTEIDSYLVIFDQFLGDLCLYSRRFVS